jgi:uncharacterized RDD family membrane protein YckC
MTPGQESAPSHPDLTPLPRRLINERFLARLIDGGILLAVLVCMGMLGRAVENTAADSIGVMAALAALAILYCYDVVMIAANGGQTVGKKIMKVKVVMLDGQPVGWAAAALRGLAPTFASCCTCGIGGTLFLLSPLFDSSPAARGWHDQIAKTVVVPA